MTTSAETLRKQRIVDFVHIRLGDFKVIKKEKVVHKGTKKECLDYIKTHDPEKKEYTLVHPSNTSGVITVAFVRDDKDPELCKAGIAFCSPKDPWFRQKGIYVALKRADTPNRRFFMNSFAFPSPKDKLDVALLTVASLGDKMPTWARDYIFTQIQNISMA